MEGKLSMRFPNKNRCLEVVYPELTKEWHPNKNKKYKPSNTFAKSGRSVWWLCKNCKYEWQAKVLNRANGNGCPSCAGKIVNDNNCLAFKNPQLISEWDYKRNSESPKEIMCGSHKKVWWVCNKCSYKWKTRIIHRYSGSGCPACNGKVATRINSLAALLPHIATEWNYNKNELGPDNFTSKSHKKVWWLCKNCKYEWSAIISSREKHGCPKCAKSPVSISGSRWLDKLSIPYENREIMIKCNNHRYIVDAYDPESNTIYEYFGDFWHGNPKMFDPKDINPINKKSFGELYNNTLSRIEDLERDGYNIIYKWGK